MANGYNRVFLVGNLGDEPVIRNTSTGSIVANITVAINEVRRDQQTGNLINETEWVRVVAFGRTAEIMQNYLHKGSQVHIEGKLRTRSYEDKNTGEKKYSTEVVCDPNGLLMLGSRQDNQNAGAYGQRDEDAVFTIEIAQLPGSEELVVDQQVYLQDPYGRPFPVKVVAKDDTNITLDANHEMAGKELNFTIELVEVK